MTFNNIASYILIMLFYLGSLFFLLAGAVLHWHWLATLGICIVSFFIAVSAIQKSFNTITFNFTKYVSVFCFATIALIIFKNKLFVSIDWINVVLAGICALLFLAHASKDKKIDEQNGRKKIYFEEFGKIQGLYQEFDEEDKLLIEGHYKDNQRIGKWVEYIYFNDVHKAYFYYKNGVKDGVYERFTQDGTIAEKGNYKNGERDGLWIEYYNSTDKEAIEIERIYNNGKCSSRKYFYENGNIKIEFLDLDGKQSIYKENGTLYMTIVQNNDKIINKKKFDDNGNVLCEMTYDNGEQNGTWYLTEYEQSAFDESNKNSFGDFNIYGSFYRIRDITEIFSSPIICIRTYKNGYLYGDYKEFYTNGQIKLERHYITEDGCPKGFELGVDNIDDIDGDDIEYYENGIIKRKASREKYTGKMLGEEWFDSDGSLTKKAIYDQSGDCMCIEHFKNNALFLREQNGEEQRYKNGVLESILHPINENSQQETIYYPNGSIKERRLYFNALDEEAQRIYDEQMQKYNIKVEEAKLEHQNKTESLKMQYQDAMNKYQAQMEKYKEDMKKWERRQQSGQSNSWNRPREPRVPDSRKYTTSSNPINNIEKPSLREIKSEIKEDGKGLFLKQGTWQFYDENGKIIKEEVYNKGNLMDIRYIQH